MAIFMGIDQGTTGTTVVLADENLQILGTGSVDFSQHFPKPGWVEHSLDEIWVSVKQAAEIALNSSGISRQKIAAIGITNQRETVGTWKKNGEAKHRAIVWQDRRTSQICDGLRPEENIIRDKTGLLVDPYFSGSKIQWMKENHGVDDCVGTMDSFLIFKLTGGKTHATDTSNASRTMLMDIKSRQYDEDLLKIFRVPPSVLPEIRDSLSDFGVTLGLDFLPDGIPIKCVLGDQQSALFGQAAWLRGSAKATYGTGSFILLNIGQDFKKSKHRLLTTIGWTGLPKSLGETSCFALEGSAFVCGALVQWLRDELHLISKAEEIEDLAKKVADSGGVSIIPAFTGMGAPFWKPQARGAILGLTRGSSDAHIARACLEALALQNALILQTMEQDSLEKINLVRVDGGASQNNLLMQMQADFAQTILQRPENIETTSQGVILGCLVQDKIITSHEDVKKLVPLEQEFHPKLGREDAVERKNIFRRSTELVASL